QHAASSQCGCEVIANILFVAGIRSGNPREFNVISVNGGVRSEKSLVHFHPPAHLHGANWIRRDGLVHITKPGKARGSSAGTNLCDTVRFESASRFENDSIDFAHSVERIRGRLVMVLRVVTERNGVDVVELVPVEIPVPDKTLAQVAVVFAHLRNGGTQRPPVPPPSCPLASF